jgi:hypothetical protein
VEEVQAKERGRGDVDARDPGRPQAPHDVVVHAAGHEAGMQGAEREVEQVIDDEGQEQRASHAHAARGQRGRPAAGGDVVTRTRRPAGVRE